MSPITGSGNEKPVYDVFTSPPFQNVSKLQKFVLNVLVQASRGLSLGCVLLKSSANTQRLGCSDRILKAIAMWYKYNLFDGLAYINKSGHFAHCSHFSSPLRSSEKILRNSQNIQTYYMLNHRINCIYTTSRQLSKSYQSTPASEYLRSTSGERNLNSTPEKPEQEHLAQIFVVWRRKYVINRLLVPRARNR